MKDADNSPDKDEVAPPSSATSTTLIERVKEGDQQSWERLMKLYSPLVLCWCRTRGTQREDAQDVAQDVFQTVFKRIAEFKKQQQRGSFRAWLRTITHHKVGDHLRRTTQQPAATGGSAAQELLAEWPDAFGDDSSVDDDPSERVILLRSAMELVRPEFEAPTWEAAMRTAVEGQRPSDVAAALGMTPSAVYTAKSRVLKRLREELDILLH
jgi:RNA polymerase sigma-70 factor (ECF subfamily)